MEHEKENLKSKLHLSESEEDERPFKKAKHLWQIKGKYNLKDSSKKGEHSSCEPSNNHQIKLDKCVRYHCNQSPKRILSRNEKLLESDDSEDENFDIPISLIDQSNDSPDYLVEWQARQVTKGFVDNTINKILENWRMDPVEVDFIENFVSNRFIEDRGVLMAIQSHGLQSEVANINVQSFEQTLKESDIENYQNAQNELMKTDSNDSGNSEDTFLDTAVAFAIQKKGLTSQGYV